MKRSKGIFGLFFLMLVLSNVSAQKDYRFFEYSAIGVRAGANYTSIGLQPSAADIGAAPSWSAGLVYVFSNKEYVGVQLEVLYSSRKWTESIDSYQVQTDLRYLEVPLMTNIILGNGRLKYMIHLGSYFAFKLGKNTQSDLPKEHPFNEGFATREERNSDFGLLIGGGMRYISSIGIFQLDIRFAYGFQKLYNESQSGFQYSNMSGLQAGIIYMINLQKHD